MYSHDVLWDYLEELDQWMLLHLHYNKKRRVNNLIYILLKEHFSFLLHTCSLFLRWNIFWTPWHFASEFLSCLRRCTAPAVKRKSQQFEPTFWGIKVFSSLQTTDCLAFQLLEKTANISHISNGFSAKWCLRNELRHSTLMSCHYPVLGSGSDWFTIGSTNQKHYPDLGSDTSSACYFRRHLAGNYWCCNRLAVFSHQPSGSYPST